MATSDMLLSGDVLLDRLTDAGEPTGYLDPAEIGALSIEETTELKTRTSKRRDTYGQVTSTVSLKQPGKLKVTLNEVNPDTLAVVLLGTTATLAQTAGDVTGEKVTLIPNRWVQLGKSNISANGTGTEITIATDEDTPVSIPLTDVEINHRTGMIKYIGSTLAEATACTIGYSYGVVSGTRVSGSVKPTVKMRVMLDGKNIVTGKDVRVVIDEATLTPASPIDFMSDDWGEIVLEGEMTTLPGKTSPYTVDFIN